MKTNYKIIKSAPNAWKWTRYKSKLLSEWEALLTNQTKKNEKDFQSFLERHPCLLPCPYGVFNVGHHGLFPSAVISQPKLIGLKSKIPDFLLLSRDSATVYANFIEIEDPNKEWATKKGNPTAKLTQAIKQLRDWKSWFNQGTNQHQFLSDYKIPQDWLDSRNFEIKCILVYGRRSDKTLSEDFNKIRSSLALPDEVFMTYDRLFPNEDFKNYFTIKNTSNGFKALEIPATLKISPSRAEFWNLIKEKENAVTSNTYLAKGRKDFLNKRWSYWDNWVNSNSVKVYNSKDEE